MKPNKDETMSIRQIKEESRLLSEIALTLFLQRLEKSLEKKDMGNREGEEIGDIFYSHIDGTSITLRSLPEQVIKSMIHRFEVFKKELKEEGKKRD
jgi:hypothetical protein